MAKNLKVGELVEVKIGCKSTKDVFWAGEFMKDFEGVTFKIKHTDVDGDNTYELEDISKGSKYDTSDWIFDGKWLKKAGVPVKSLSVQHKGKSTVISTSNMSVAEIAEFTTELAKPVVKRQVAMIKSATGMTLILDSATYNLQSDHVNYHKIVERLANKDYNGLEDLINVSKAVESFGEGKLVVKGGVVYYNGKQLHGCITGSILGLIKDGFSVEPIVNFLDNLSKNPSFRAQNELYSFLEYGKLPITEDGCFLTYKKINKNWKDIHSGKFDNSIGAVCEMPRHEVDDNSNNTCSSGLHVCSYEYTKSFGGSDSRLVLCKVNPADVVSIPVDYNNTKMRCCKYQVVAEVTDKSDVLKGKSLYKA